MVDFVVYLKQAGTAVIGSNQLAIGAGWLRLLPLLPLTRRVTSFCFPMSLRRAIPYTLCCITLAQFQSSCDARKKHLRFFEDGRKLKRGFMESK